MDILLAALLRGYFGRHWFLWSWAIIALTFAPVVWFWNDIQLDAPIFVSEWIKAALTSFVILLIVETVSNRRRRHERQARAYERVQLDFIVPLRRLLAALAALRDVATHPAPEQADGLRAEIRREWQAFSSHSRAEPLASTATDFSSELLVVIQTAPYARCQNIIDAALKADASRVQKACDAAEQELRQLQDRFEQAYANQAREYI